MKASAVETLKCTQGFEKNASTFTITTQELPTTLDLTLLTLQCIVIPTGTEKQARKKKSEKRKNQSCAKRDLEFRDLSCTLSCLCVHPSPLSLSLSLSLALSRCVYAFSKIISSFHNESFGQNGI
jgi:hypothetical protein